MPVSKNRLKNKAIKSAKKSSSLSDNLKRKRDLILVDMDKHLGQTASPDLSFSENLIRIFAQREGAEYASLNEHISSTLEIFNGYLVKGLAVQGHTSQPLYSALSLVSQEEFRTGELAAGLLKNKQALLLEQRSESDDIFVYPEGAEHTPLEAVIKGNLSLMTYDATRFLDYEKLYNDFKGGPFSSVITKLRQLQSQSVFKDELQLFYHRLFAIYLRMAEQEALSNVSLEKKIRELESAFNHSLSEDSILDGFSELKVTDPLTIFLSGSSEQVATSFKHIPDVSLAADFYRLKEVLKKQPVELVGHPDETMVFNFSCAGEDLSFQPKQGFKKHHVRFDQLRLEYIEASDSFYVSAQFTNWDNLGQYLLCAKVTVDPMTAVSGFSLIDCVGQFIKPDNELVARLNSLGISGATEQALSEEFRRPENSPFSLGFFRKTLDEYVRVDSLSPEDMGTLGGKPVLFYELAVLGLIQAIPRLLSRHEYADYVFAVDEDFFESAVQRDESLAAEDIYDPEEDGSTYGEDVRFVFIRSPRWFGQSFDLYQDDEKIRRAMVHLDKLLWSKETGGLVSIAGSFNRHERCVLASTYNSEEHSRTYFETSSRLSVLDRVDEYKFTNRDKDYRGLVDELSLIIISAAENNLGKSAAQFNINAAPQRDAFIVDSSIWAPPSQGGSTEDKRIHFMEQLVGGNIDFALSGLRKANIDVSLKGVWFIATGGNCPHISASGLYPRAMFLLPASSDTLMATVFMAQQVEGVYMSELLCTQIAFTGGSALAGHPFITEPVIDFYGEATIEAINRVASFFASDILFHLSARPQVQTVVEDSQRCYLDYCLDRNGYVDVTLLHNLQGIANDEGESVRSYISCVAFGWIGSRHNIPKHLSLLSNQNLIGPLVDKLLAKGPSPVRKPSVVIGRKIENVSESSNSLEALNHGRSEEPAVEHADTALEEVSKEEPLQETFKPAESDFANSSEPEGQPQAVLRLTEIAEVSNDSAAKEPKLSQESTQKELELPQVLNFDTTEEVVVIAPSVDTQPTDEFALNLERLVALQQKLRPKLQADRQLRLIQHLYNAEQMQFFGLRPDEVLGRFLLPYFRSDCSFSKGQCALAPERDHYISSGDYSLWKDLDEAQGPLSLMLSALGEGVIHNFTCYDRGDSPQKQYMEDRAATEPGQIMSFEAASIVLSQNRLYALFSILRHQEREGQPEPDLLGRTYYLACSENLSPSLKLTHLRSSLLLGDCAMAYLDGALEQPFVGWQDFSTMNNGHIENIEFLTDWSLGLSHYMNFHKKNQTSTQFGEACDALPGAEQSGFSDSEQAGQPKDFEQISGGKLKSVFDELEIRFRYVRKMSLTQNYSPARSSHSSRSWSAPDYQVEVPGHMRRLANPDSFGRTAAGEPIQGWTFVKSFSRFKDKPHRQIKSLYIRERLIR